MQSRVGVIPSLLWVVASLLLGLSTAASAADKQASSQDVDSGSFGVFMNGRRIATETFSIHQSSSGSSVTSEFKAEAGLDKAMQSSNLQLDSKGDLKSYEWTESSPGQSHAIVVPDKDFLLERFSSTPEEKPHEQPFLLPASTSILDDYFFVQRQVLAWKYLATSCKQENGQIACPMKEPAQLGTLNAHARSSAPVSLEYAGREKISIRGVERDLIRLDAKGEAGDWTLWLDNQLKLQRILEPGSNTEVVRD